MTKPGYIYCITNLVDGKKYVGETMYPEDRWSQHKRNINRTLDKVKQHPLVNAIRKYGANNFTFEVVAKYDSAEEALSHENYWIDHFQSRVTQHGYNLKDGGRGGSVFAESTLAKMSKQRKGKKASDRARNNMSASSKAAWARRRAPRLLAVKELQSLGLYNFEIAKELGLSGGTVGKYLKEMGLQSHVLTEKGKKDWVDKISGENHYHATRISDVSNKIIELRAQGWGIQRISDELKTSFTTIHKVLKEHKVPKSRAVRSDKGQTPPKIKQKRQETVPVILELRSQGMTLTEIRKVVKTSFKFVADVVREHSN